jgi:hypothetical protein
VAEVLIQTRKGLEVQVEEELELNTQVVLLLFKVQNLQVAAVAAVLSILLPLKVAPAS